jgi:hypothetical protein
MRAVRPGVRPFVARLTTLALALAPLGCDVASRPGSVALADSAAGEIPFRLAGTGGAALIVPVHVNGQGPSISSSTPARH